MSHAAIKIGQRHGKLVVRGRDHFRTKLHGRVYWRCRCDCGNMTSTTGTMLAAGLKQNCRPCGHKKGAAANMKHGLSRRGIPYPPDYNLWVAAKRRARIHKLPFTISPKDIVIPEYFPVFPLIKLELGTREDHENSPSLDQVVPGVGYTLNNVWVISYRANRIKHNATLDELRALTNAVAARLEHK